jgi:NCS2 family nucleobase:cation symporter-2
MTGMRMIASQGFTKRNNGIVGLALAFGVGIPMVPGSLAGLPAQVVSIIGGSSVILVTILVVILNLVMGERTTEQC